jgi:rubrerythrin
MSHHYDAGGQSRLSTIISLEKELRETRAELEETRRRAYEELVGTRVDLSATRAERDTARRWARLWKRAARGRASWRETAEEIAAQLATARAEAAVLREALESIAKGSSGYRGGGGFMCDWCMEAGAEWCADKHPDKCPRTIARRALTERQEETTK